MLGIYVNIELANPLTKRNLLVIGQIQDVFNVSRNQVSSSSVKVMQVVEDKFFTPHNFISLATHTTSTLSWILGKFLLKPKRAHIYTKNESKPMVQSHSTSSHFWLMIQVHESYRGNFGSRGLEGQEVCSVKLQWFKVDKGKHVVWHVFPNSLNSNRLVCNR